MICALCLKDKILRKSHIIAEFMYKPLYDKLHRFHVMSTDPKHKHSFGQKGSRERLLCEDCEQLLGVNENYVRQVFKGGTGITIQANQNPIIIGDINYKKFKLFELSLLWRASISKLEFFKNIKLSSGEEEDLRKAILNGDPLEPEDYGCIISIILYDKNRIADDIIMEPDVKTVNNYKCYRFVLGGCFWIFVSQIFILVNEFPGKELFLSKEGKQVIRLETYNNIHLFQVLSQKLRNKPK